MEQSYKSSIDDCDELIAGKHIPSTLVHHTNRREAIRPLVRLLSALFSPHLSSSLKDSSFITAAHEFLYSVHCSSDFSHSSISHLSHEGMHDKNSICLKTIVE
ncbi:hypothetical protein BLNAU_12867 [Blattamonas nauphoetae]|uniref:Uncharacterized protein n=1 Tax=Blattamonas nauphoetae TaxID=2049346 RepID=A0ABQ9XN05_9EUKA|nr:hypothetical protein BLNAU_12867 [Blattamonas nauphoetae]